MNKDSILSIKNNIDPIIDYIKDHPGISYYELKAYAFDNDKHEWLNMMKNGSLAKKLSDECKAIKKEHHINYNLKHIEAMNLCLDAETKYYARRAPEDMAKELAEAPEWQKGSIRAKYAKRIELASKLSE